MLGRYAETSLSYDLRVKKQNITKEEEKRKGKEREEEGKERKVKEKRYLI